MKIDAKDIEELLSQYQPEFVVDENSEEHVLIMDEGVKTVISIRSQDFDDFIQDKFMGAHKGKMAPASLIKEFEGVCGYRARRSGKIQPLPLRVAWEGQSIIYNFDGPNGEQVEITPKGPVLVRNKVVFRKGKGLFVPLADATDINRIFDFVNINNEYNRTLYLVTIGNMYVPDISHCILVLHGPPGSAKTSGTWVSSMLVEPKNEEVLSIPKTMRSLEIVVNERHVSAFDNVPVLSDEMSDFFCKSTTGQSAVTRRNYTDSGTVTRTLKRCFIFNGLECVARNRDLLERSMIIQLNPIPEGKRLSELDFKNAFRAALPGLRSAFFELLSKALNIYFNDRPKIPLKRLSDFTSFGWCIAEAYHKGYGDRFLAAYNKNGEDILREDAVTRPLISYLLQYLDSLDLTQPMTLPFGEFYNTFYDFCAKNCRGFQRSSIPPTSAAFSHQIRQYKPVIEREGYRFAYLNRSNKNQPIEISRIQLEPSPVLEADFSAEKPDERGA